MNPKDRVRYDKPEDRDLLIAYLDTKYEKELVLKEWDLLLNHASSESEVQDFLERYPDFLPGIDDKHNGPLASIIATQFPFGSDYVSDFAFVTVNSMECQFTFVEIEAPHKRLFTKDYLFTQPFNQALQQVRDWYGWATKNIDSIVNMYADLFEFYDVSRDRKTIKCYLVYGRREQVQSPIIAKERWASLGQSLGDGIEVMTYDRLTAHVAIERDSALYNSYAVCSYRQRGFYWKPRFEGQEGRRTLIRPPRVNR